jgi:hypothetical protein
MSDTNANDLPEWVDMCHETAWRANDLFREVCDWCVGCCLPACGELRPEMLEALRAVASFKSCPPDGTFRGQAEWRAGRIHQAASAVAKMIAASGTFAAEGWQLEELEYVREQLESCVMVANRVADAAAAHDRAMDELFNPRATT